MLPLEGRACSAAGDKLGLPNAISQIGASDKACTWKIFRSPGSCVFRICRESRAIGSRCARGRRELRLLRPAGERQRQLRASQGRCVGHHRRRRRAMRRRFARKSTGTNFTVTIAHLPAGKYTITIGEVETLASAPGERLFDVTFRRHRAGQEFRHLRHRRRGAESLLHHRRGRA